MRQSNPRRKRAFSLIELVIVVVIIGIIAAIAIPRMSRGAEGAADAALNGDLAVMRSSIDLFVTEHVGTYPNLATFAAEMTGNTNLAGTAGSGAGFIYGPYLRAVPPLPVGMQKGNNGVKALPPDGSGADMGWAYDAATGEIRANSVDFDVNGDPYSGY